MNKEDDLLLYEERDDENDGWYEYHRIKADKGQSLLRIDKFLQLRLENVSRNKIQNASKAGGVRVNGVAVKPNYKVKPEDEVTVLLLKPPSSKETLPEDIPLEIVYEDEDLMLINKPAGMVVHPGVGVHSGTLVNALMHYFTVVNPVKNLENELDPMRPGLVHRIDKNTSGLLVIAKSDYANTKLCTQFFDRTTDRKYVALVWGDFAEDTGTIVGNIGRDERNRKMFKVYPPDSEIGKHAVTHYKVLQRFGYVTLVECKLETGRTHQIRVHMKHIGHTLFNDPEYGGNRVLKGTKFTKYLKFVENCFSLIPGQALHAKTLEFEHPTTGKRLSFDSPLPTGFQEILQKWERYVSGATQLDTDVF